MIERTLVLVYFQLQLNSLAVPNTLSMAGTQRVGFHYEISISIFSDVEKYRYDQKLGNPVYWSTELYFYLKYTNEINEIKIL